MRKRLQPHNRTTHIDALRIKPNKSAHAIFIAPTPISWVVESIIQKQLIDLLRNGTTTRHYAQRLNHLHRNRHRVISRRSLWSIALLPVNAPAVCPGHINPRRREIPFCINKGIRLRSISRGPTPEQPIEISEKRTKQKSIANAEAVALLIA